MNAHKRGQIETCIDSAKVTFYKVYTGCKYLDDYYCVDTAKHALSISKEVQMQYNNGTLLTIEEKANNWDVSINP